MGKSVNTSHGTHQLGLNRQFRTHHGFGFEFKDTGFHAIEFNHQGQRVTRFDRALETRAINAGKVINGVFIRHHIHGVKRQQSIRLRQRLTVHVARPGGQRHRVARARREPRVHVHGAVDRLARHAPPAGRLRVDREQRRDLHRKAAIEIRALFRNRSVRRVGGRGTTGIGSHLAQLAHHYTQSGEVKPALQYLSMAAQAALADNSPEAALKHFEEAIRIVTRKKAEMSRDPSGGEGRQADLHGGYVSLEMLERVHGHVLQQSALCCIATGEVHEGAVRLSLSLMTSDDLR